MTVLNSLIWVINTHPEALDKWETDFIEDVLRKYGDDSDLTYHQERKAEEIIKKVKRKEGEPLI